MKRCDWVPINKLIYVNYHDVEWGKLENNDKRLFEFLILEMAQAGLSWYTVLTRREQYALAFQNYDLDYVSNLTILEQEVILNKFNIIKNKQKLKASVRNAKVFKKIQLEYNSFYNYILQFLPNHQPIINSWSSVDQIPKYTDIAVTISSDLKDKGMSFVGPTIIYSFLQATGFVNDHLVYCFRYKQLKDLVLS